MSAVLDRVEKDTGLGSGNAIVLWDHLVNRNVEIIGGILVHTGKLDELKIAYQIMFDSE